MGDLTANFSRSEFACRCGCGFDTVDAELINALQAGCYFFTERYGEPVRCDITGPNRCYQHNIDERGAKDSEHPNARAADHKFYLRKSGKQISPDEVADYYEDAYPGKWGVGRYHNRTHLDTRSNGPARWDART